MVNAHGERIVRRRTVGFVAGLAVVVLVASVLVRPASAVTTLSLSVDFPDPVTVGESGRPASVSVTNTSTGVEATGNVTVNTLTLVPSCASTSPDCAGAADPGTFRVSPTGTGAAGTDCAGQAFTITVVDPATGKVQFTPSAGPLILGSGRTCGIDFTIDVLKVPDIDASPPAPGVQTNQVPFAAGTHDNGTTGTGTGRGSVTVLQATPTLMTSATPTVTLGQSIADTATVVGASGAPPPTGTVTFTVFGPNNVGCVGAPAFVSANRPLAGGPPPMATSDPFSPVAEGTYFWVASYSGDANHSALTAPCNSANEQSVVNPAALGITTVATPSVVLGQSINDSATVTPAPGAPVPTGTVTFTVFGPNDASCSGASVFTSTQALTPGQPPMATSAPFTPTAIGTYRWIAVYSGDANYPGGSTACNDPNEVSVVMPPAATIATTATPSATIGQPISDSATVSGPAGAPAPTGTVTFRAYGPNDVGCASSIPAFTSLDRPLIGGPSPGAASAPFTPLTIGVYRWIASYSGDANYPPVSGACNDPGESSTVTAAATTTPTIATQATPTVPIGQAITDTAVVTGTAGGPAPTGTVTFQLFGPNNVTCTGTAVFTATSPLVAGAPPAASAASGAFTPAAVGSYNWTAAYFGDANYDAVSAPCGAPDETSSVLGLDATVTTQATPMAFVGQPISDTATVLGPPGAPVPTGTVTFRAFSPGNTTCTAAHEFSSSATLTGGPNPTASSGPFTTFSPGIHRWVATYSGDATYAPVTTSCNDPNEASLVQQVPPTISTQATANAALGQTITDTATIAGAPGVPAPTGMISFLAFGPNNPSCNGPAAFTSPNKPLTGSTATSDPFPALAGTYLWTASYTGDSTYAPATTACGDPGETSIVNKHQPAITTSATPTSTVGLVQPISDVASVTGITGYPGPMGTVTFRLFGPNDDLCLGAPVFTSPLRPFTASNPAVFFSEPFTPTAAGTYRWVADYSGDSNYLPVTSPCNADNETLVVGPGQSVLTTQAVASGVVGQPITDTATVTGFPSSPAPTGTVSFTLFGPNDQSCSGPPAFTSANRPLGGGAPPTATSEPFVPSVAGVYLWVATYNGDANYMPDTSPCGLVVETSTIARAGPSITTQATPTAVAGQPIVDTATVAGVPGGPPPTGTVTFTAFGPGDPTCSGGAVFISGARPLGGGPPPVATSESFPTPTPGTYTWVASYSGDASYVPSSGACGDSGESSAVGRATPTVVTQAAANVPIGQPISDAATLSGPLPAAPTGTVTFSAYGPDDAACSGPPAFVAPNRPLASGNATSGPFVPQAPGIYRWVVTYAGDGNYTSATSACNAANESSIVNGARPSITTQASPASTRGSVPLHDTATLANGFKPTGTITFRAFGPDDATCSASPAFVSTVAVSAGNGTYPSAAFLPVSPGTYRWVAAYSGDVQNQAVSTACNDPNEQVVVKAIPTIAVAKGASPTSLPEPGGTFTFSVSVTNLSDEPLVVTSMVDNVYGNLNGRGSCAVGATMGPAGTYACSFSAAFTGNASMSETDTVSITAMAQDQFAVTGADQATVTITDVAPTISVQKTAMPPTLAAPGGTFTFGVVVTNTSAEQVQLESLVDAPYGDLNGRGTCSVVPRPALSPGGTYSCFFSASFTGSGEASQTDTVTATVVDDDGSRGSGQASATVRLVAPVTLTTQASGPAVVGGTIRDTALLSGGSAPAGLTGSITFTLFGPDNPTCSGPPLFTSTVPVVGSGTYLSAEFTTTAPGVYRWVAAYSGDANNSATGTPCNDPAEQLTVTRAPVQVTTQATPQATLGQAISDTATVTGGFGPSGTITFSLFGPGDVACAGVPVFSSVASLGASGVASSAPFAPAAPGVYRWIAVYSGDANNALAVTACNDPNETSTIVGNVAVAVQYAANPGSRPEPGGTFTLAAVVTNVGSTPFTITTLADSVYGDLALIPGTCSTAIGVGLTPGDTYACQYGVGFFGPAGQAQLNTVTVVVVGGSGATASARADTVIGISPVIPPPPPPPPPPPTVPETVSPTTTPASTVPATTAPPTPTTVPTVTTTVPLTTAVPSTTSTVLATTTTTTTPGPTTTAVPAVELDRPSVEPGGRLVATGHGCAPGGPVELTIMGQPAGRAVADAAGRFTAPINIPDLEVGRYDLVAACGPILTTSFDVVVVSQVDPGTSSLLVLLFVLLLALAYCANRIVSYGGRHAT